jgi:FMN hydrolase / 5-amino-6-(5-phospho-D-ribitylamino)uracil phosphatase
MGYSRPPDLLLTMLNINKIKAITLDLDDTLWPVWPAIERAEKALETWMSQRAPMAAALFANASTRDDIRSYVLRTRPELKHNLSAVRLEAIRVALYRANENPLLAEQAFDVFFAARNQVTLYDDALLALEFLAARFPVVALSNGNADIEKIGIHRYFRASISAQAFGVGKPDPRIFHAAAGAVEASPDSVLHIGDDAGLDVMGALNAGMQTAWLNRADKLWIHDQNPHITVSNLTELCDCLAEGQLVAA